MELPSMFIENERKYGEEKEEKRIIIITTT